MASEDNNITSLFIDGFQDLFGRIAYLDDKLLYKVNAGQTILFLNNLAEFLETLPNDLYRYLLLVLKCLLRTGPKCCVGYRLDGV